MITQARLNELEQHFICENNDEEGQTWRNHLTSEELVLVNKWDNRYALGMLNLYQDVINLHYKN